MDFDTLIKLWPIVTGLVTAVMAIGVLFYRMSASEKRAEAQDKLFAEMASNDKIDHTAIAAKVDMLNASLNAFKLNVVADYVTRDELNRTMARIENKFDALNETILKLVAKQ